MEAKNKPMKNQTSLYWLVPLTGFLALAASGAGLFWQGGNGSFPFTTVHGQEVEISGRGIYQNDMVLYYVGMVGSWVIMGVLAVWLLLAFFRSLDEAPAPQSAQMVKAA